MVFIGDDTEFVPREPWPRHNGDIASGKLQREWEAVSGGRWGAPNWTMWKDRRRFPATVGLPDAAPEPRQRETFESWAYDERGSFNAVNFFLRKLGVRWLMPDELGEFYPSMKSIPLPKMDETVRPDFEIRQFSVHGPNEWSLWGMRLGVRYPYGMNTAHGMTLLNREEVFKAHPDWFAMYGGERRFVPGSSYNQFCYSNPELFQEMLRCVRAQFDVYDYEGVSVMPPDGYISSCQCPLCLGKDEPDRSGERGTLSNYVWDFVNRIAKEIAKTYPGKLIYCCAYGEYSAPPTNIAKLEPNVQVVIVGGHNPKSGIAKQPAVRAFRESWLPKTDRPIQIFENYPMTSRGWYLPSFMARTIGKSINETKGSSRGDEIWITPSKGTKGDMIFNSFLYYFTARMYWGGQKQDPGELLDEYCQLMFGPASDTMKRFFDHCEVHWTEMESDKGQVDKALALFDSAKAEVAPQSPEGIRLSYFDDFLRDLRNKSVALGQKRGLVPQIRLVGDAEGIVIDGKIDEPFWQTLNPGSAGRLREVQTGLKPAFGTSFKVGWLKNNLYFAVHCEESPGSQPNIATKKAGDPAIWYGDLVEFLIQTDSHSYYQIAVNPAGVVVDFDRGASKAAWDSWGSGAEVATQIGDGFWTVEMRLPVTTDTNDPLHQIVGRTPSASLPWYFNICRQRVRKSGTELSAFSPTGKPSFHEPMQFAHLYSGLSHTFEVDPTVKIFPTALAEAMKGPKEEMFAASVALLDAAENLSDLQKSVALKSAAAAARSLKDLETADALAARIPLEAERKLAEMANLVARRQAKELIERFGNEDMSQWPFWVAAEGRQIRSVAFSAVGKKAQAIADLEAVYGLTTEPRILNRIAESLEGLRASK